MPNGLKTENQVRAHMRKCTICRLPEEIRSEINRLLLLDASDQEIVEYAYNEDKVINEQTIPFHRDYLKYVTDDTLVSKTLIQLSLGEETEIERIAKFNAEIAEAKAKLLKGIYVSSLPKLKEAQERCTEGIVYATNARDFGTAFEGMIKSVALLEGKPTEILKAEYATNGKLSLTGLDKLDALIGGVLGEKSEE